MENVETRLRKIISSTTKISQNSFLLNDDLIEKCGIDSMQRIEIAISIEKEFEIEVPDDEVSTLRTLLDFVNLVNKYNGIKK